ncbi:MAG: V-type ATPase subunit subunit G family protein [Anaerolineae bacterium]
MPDQTLSPLLAIKQREIAVADRIASAHQAAERAVLDARQAASQARDQAERDGRAQAEVTYRAELDAAEIRAGKIRAHGDAAATAVLEQGSAVLDEAVRRILAVVLPSAEEE